MKNGNALNGNVAFDWIVGGIRDIPQFFARPIHVINDYRPSDLRPDIVAGLNVAVVLTPQAIAYALIAGLPPYMGLYAAVVASIVGSLWGSSYHLQTGPTNAVSLLMFYSLLTVAETGSYEFIVAAGLMAVMVGIIQILVGVAHMGVLVNFVSDSVITGFTAGAGILIAVSQLPHLLRIPVDHVPGVYNILLQIGEGSAGIHPPSLILGLVTLGVMIGVGTIKTGMPITFVGMVVSALVVVTFGLQEQDVVVLGELPRQLPPIANIPILDLELVGKLSTGALAVSAIGLVEAISISRSVAAESGQRIDSNQEFVGQGLSNIFAGLFSGYSCSGSFTRTVVNYSSGGRTAMSGVYAGVWVLVAIMIFGPFASYLPRAGLACVLIVTAWRMVNRVEIARIFRSSNGDTIIMIVTFMATLFLPLEFAVLAGMLVSFAQYLVQSATPRVWPVVPDDNFRYFLAEDERSVCPQLGMIAIEGSLYFGAVHHVENAIRLNSEQHPDQYLLLLRLHLVDKCDVSGIHMLESVVRRYRERNGDVYLVGARPQVVDMMEASGFIQYLGKDNLLSREDAVSHLFHNVLDYGICKYHCNVRVFAECQPIIKSGDIGNSSIAVEVKEYDVDYCSAQDLHSVIGAESGEILVFDVREKDEYKRIRIPGSSNLPITHLMKGIEDVSKDANVYLVCRSGRRSLRAAHMMNTLGYQHVRVLGGGMLGWEAAGYKIIFQR
tara:strand:- start:1903 stop:4068 length:2166 start_codon:yes stop_codon:yes gene_type:complete